VKIYHSQVTLEYDLAEAGDNNAAIMAEVWNKCFTGMPGTFNSNLLTTAGNDRTDKALCAWRGICRASHSGSKAEFAQRLAARLDIFKDSKPVEIFEVPSYIAEAIKLVAGKVNGTVSAVENSSI
jgi:putative ATP-dependent endonuclease of OLD family